MRVGVLYLAAVSANGPARIIRQVSMGPPGQEELCVPLRPLR